jgi:hypothetical protein
MTGKNAKDCWLEEQATFAIYSRTILEALRGHTTERLRKDQLRNDSNIFEQ